jgi:hypothetical protein
MYVPSDMFVIDDVYSCYAPPPHTPAIPAFLPKPKNVSTAEEIQQRQETHDLERDGPGGAGSSAGADAGAGAASDKPKMTFRLLGRDAKGRVETRQLMVPKANKIAAKLLQKGEKQRLEKEFLKEKTLMYETMSESDTQTVAYLDNKDHFEGGCTSSRAPTQRSLESSSQGWKGSGGGGGGGKQSGGGGGGGGGGREKDAAGVGYSLDLDGFLAIARSEETTKFRGAVKDNASAAAKKGGGGR